MRYAVISQNESQRLVPEPLLNTFKNTAIINPPTSIGTLSTLPHPTTFNPSFSFSPTLQTFLAGRELLLDELPFSIQEIHNHYQHGYIHYEYGIETKTGKPNCNRCGNKNRNQFSYFHCARCEQHCLYCRKCIMLGRVSQCTPLLRWTGPLPMHQIQEPVLSWKGELSEAQSKASQHLIQAIEEKNPFLIWAV